MKKSTSPLGQVWYILRRISLMLWESDKKALFVVLVGKSLAGLTMLPNLYIDRLFWDNIVLGLAHSEFPRTTLFTTIIYLSIARILIHFFRMLVDRTTGYHMSISKWRLQAYLEKTISTKYSKIPVPTIESSEFKDIVSRVEREAVPRLLNLSDQFFSIFGSAVFAISALSVFIFGQPFLVALSILYLIPNFLIDKKLISWNFKMEKDLSEKYRLRGMVLSYLTKSTSYLEVRLLQITNYLMSKMKYVWSEIFDKKKEFMLNRQVSRYLTDLPYSIFSFAVDGYFAMLAILGNISLGTAQAYIRAITAFNTNARDISVSLTSFYENFLFITDISWYLDLPEITDLNTGINLNSFKKGIEFRRVWFRYAKTGAWILKDVSLKISADKDIAIVGENGAGKSTLIKLLCGLYTPTKGEIYINGLKINSIKKESYWSQLAILFQDYGLFGFSARENIGLGREEKINDIDEIRRFAKMAQIDDWIESLPLKYNNPLNRDFKDGVLPSGGQMQRMAIARSLMRDSKILILDEPTSNVDPQAEENIFNNLLDVAKDKILIFISHRFSTVRRADEIFVMEDGKISEQGSHEKLMKLNGKYAHLFNLQAKSYQ